MRIKIVLLMMSLGMGILTQAQNTIKGSLKEPDGKKITDIQVYVSDLNRSEKVNSDLPKSKKILSWKLCDLPLADV